MSRWVADVDRSSERGQPAHGGQGTRVGWGVESQALRGRAPTPGYQRHPLSVQKPDFSTGEKEHRIAGPSVAEVQFFHHPRSVLGGQEVCRSGRACPGLRSGRPGGTTLSLEARKG